MKNLKAGSWKTVITPPLGVCIAGHFSEIRAQEIMDDLYVNALVLDDGKTQVAIVSIDICSIKDHELLEYVVIEIEKRCGIKKDNIIIATTHTHAGPRVSVPLEGFGLPSPYYVEFFKESLITAVCMAQKCKQNVRVGAGRSQNDKLVHNRRMKKPDGQIVMNWVEEEFLKDTIPSGPVDTEVIAISFEGNESNTVAIIVNYALHNNAVGGPKISADLVGQMRIQLEHVYGKDAVILFLPGACGNINWINALDPNYLKQPELYKKIGTSLAGTVIEALGMMEYQNGTEIMMDNTIVEIKDRPYTEYDLKEDDTFGRGEGRKTFFDGYRRDWELHGNDPLKTHEISLSGIKIGNDLAIVTNPAELFCEFGMEIKQKSPFKYTVVSEFTNGCIDYIPTRKAIEEGGYEARRMNGNSQFEADSGEKITDGSLALLNKLKA